MPKAIDETGKIYNEWVVLERDPKSIGERAKWICECQFCKNKHIISGTHLRRDTPKCQICRRNEKEQSEIGNQYGDFTIISFSRVNNDRHYYWNCQCKCGNIEEIRITDLKDGSRYQCQECAKKENPQYIDETGNQYGYLTVIKYDETSEKNASWICQCKCGNILSVKGSKLRSGQTSCGCIKSKGEFKINQLLTENNIFYRTQIYFKDCINPKTLKELPFDFGVYEDEARNNLKYLIEYDGEQHFKNTGYGILEETQERDEIKNQYCKEHNIPLIRIPYTEYENLTIQDLIK